MSAGSRRSTERRVSTVHDHLADSAVRHPDKSFIVSIGQGTEITFRRFDDLAHRFAWFLAALGVSNTDRVSILAQNTIECALAYLGAQRHGAVVNPVNIRASEMAVEAILAEVDPSVVLHSAADGDLAERVRAAAPNARWVSWFDLDDPQASPASLFRELELAPTDPWPGPEGDAGSLALIVHTSGTGSKPKGVVHTRDSMRCSTEASIELVGMSATDRILEFRDLSWISPQVLTLAASAATGATAVLAPTFSRSQFFTWLAELEITVAVGVPAAINMLLDATEYPAPVGPFPHLRFMTSSTAPLSPERQRAFEARYGIQIQQFMGMSEAGWIAGNRPGRRKVGTVGQAAPYQDLRIVDEEGSPVGRGVEGQIVVGGDQIAHGYLQDGVVVPMEDRSTLRTGDLGLLDEEGYLTVTGRIKELIIRGGVNVSGLAVSTALMGHPCVADAATVGVPDPIYGEEIASAVVLAAPVAVDALVEHCRSCLSPNQVPRTIKFVDVIPRTERAKVDTAAVRALLT